MSQEPPPTDEPLDVDDTGEHLIVSFRETMVPGSGVARHATDGERVLIREATTAKWDELEDDEPLKHVFEWTRALLLWHGSWEDDGKFSWYTGVSPAAIDAWNRMAEANVGVIRSIKKNEEHLRKYERQSRKRSTIALACALVLLVAGAFTIRTALRAEREIARQVALGRAAVVSMEQNQRAGLEALAAMTDAQAKAIEARATLDPDHERKAAAAALKAQAKSLEAQKQLAATPSARAQADKELREVQKKQESE